MAHLDEEVVEPLGGGGGPRGPRRPNPPDPALSALRMRRCLSFLALTLMAPGSAQLVAGSSSRHSEKLSRARLAVARASLCLWACALLVAGVLAGVAVIDRDRVLGLLTHPWVIRPLALALLGGAVIWPLLLLDAWRIGQAPELTRRSRRWIALLSAVLMMLTFVVPLALGQRVWAAADLLSGVFGSGKHSAAVDGRYNVLLLGGDTGPTRVGTRPDSVNLASIDEKTGRTALFSMPRNLQNVPFPAGTPAAQRWPEGYDCGDDCLLNAIYTYGNDHPALFPGTQDPGAEAMMQAVQGITGLKVNYYVIIDLQGFQDLVDAVGGIDVDVVARTPIGGGTSKIHGWIEAGRQHLDGYHSLWYARSRETTSDYDRMARQRCVMTSMVNQLDPATVLEHFRTIASASTQVVSTDIPARRLPMFLELARKAKGNEIESVQFVPPLIVPKNPDYSEVRRQVTSTIGILEGDPEKRASTPVVTPSAAATSTTGQGSSEADAMSSESSRSAAVNVRSVCASA
ncbi:hypothetical protein Kisp02_18400 [Kineosporia sp. NBRC 101731]|nr:hypothetical protein Kisp02_18400 [Kineosporia sp. NBRC 101731]